MRQSHRILTAGVVQKSFTFPVEKLIQAMDSTLLKNIQTHKNSHTVSGSPGCPEAPPPCPLRRSSPLYRDHPEPDQLQKPQAHFLQQTSRNSITQHNKALQLQPGTTHPPNSAVIRILRSLSFDKRPKSNHPFPSQTFASLGGDEN